MQHRRAIGWTLVIGAAILTVIRLGSMIARVPEPGTVLLGVHVGLWELLLVLLMIVSFVFVLWVYRRTKQPKPPVVEGQMANPAIINFLFGDRESAPLWAVVRLYVAFAWLSAGYAKVRDDAWMVSGTALKHFWMVTTRSSTQGQNPPLAYDWYHAFLTFMLQNDWYIWLAKLIALGELAVGLCLLCGAFVGIAALFGAALNFNYALAGSAGANTVLLMLGGMLVTSWMVAGYIGLDRYLLSHLGTPWHRTKRATPQHTQPTHST